MNVNREFIARWADTLESGEYPQTRGALHRLVPDGDMPAGYCCIGVACVVAGIEGKPSANWNGCEQFGATTHSAPKALRRRVGPLDWNDLAARNDGTEGHHPHSFVEIAAHLRATYLNETEEAS